MADFYDAKAVEEKFYKIWEERGYFELDGNKKIQEKGKNFCIMMPPPNVTGVLHIGHSLTFTLQDIMTRYKRMDGYRALYQPGMDHAGIATQNVVEKRLLAQGIKKETLGREKFVSEIWKWKEQSGGTILKQMRRLGITPAWSRLRFTMDDGLKSAVRRAFVSLYNAGLIVRGNYMVNWCTHDGALSDVEVEHKENDGKLYYIRYYFADGVANLDHGGNLQSNLNDKSACCKDNTDAKYGADLSQISTKNLDATNAQTKQNAPYIIVATTRPETYFGDTAVMVNPRDERYKHLIGQKLILPLVGREIEIIGDEHVDMEFGTGVVKVTPAHDQNDYEVGKRHGLEFLTIFDEKGI